jgi:hypothetical protein
LSRNPFIQAGVSSFADWTKPSKRPPGQPVRVVVGLEQERRNGEMRTPRVMPSEPYLPMYLVTSPVPIEWPTSVTSRRSSSSISIFRSEAKVS